MVEQRCNRCGGNAVEEMKEQLRTRVDQRSGLDNGQAAKPVEKHLTG